MADRGWTPGKIVLVVAAVLAGLALVCCGIGWLLWHDQFMGGIHFVSDMQSFAEDVKSRLGTDAVVGFQANDEMEGVVTVGVPGDLTPERIREVQDKAWASYAASFAKNGGAPVRYLGVGAPAQFSGGRSGVRGWSRNVVAIDELVRRTGVAAPPVAKFIPESFGGAVSVEVRTGTTGAPGTPESGGTGKPKGDSGGEPVDK